MISTNVATTIIVDSAVKPYAEELCKEIIGSNTRGIMFEEVSADEINLDQGALSFSGFTSLHRGLQRYKRRRGYNPESVYEEEIAEWVAEELVVQAKKGVLDRSVAAILMSEEAFDYTGFTCLFLPLVEAIKARQRKFGWKEVEVYVLRENGNFEFC